MSRSRIYYWGLNLFLTLTAASICTPANAGTVTFSDLNLGDAMSITGITNTAYGVTVTESYGESEKFPIRRWSPFFQMQETWRLSRQPIRISTKW
jgi:hypothetical protein